MPNYFTLTRISKPEEGPVKFTIIDEEMCAHFKVPVHPTMWHSGWYDIHGLKLAMGKTWDQMRADFQVLKTEYQKEGSEDAKEMVKAFDHLLEITDWLEANFTPNAWYGRKE